MIERVAVIATKSIVTARRFCKKESLWKMKLDSDSSRRHTQTTVMSETRTLELVPPMRAQLAVLVLFIVTVILILPR